MATATSTFNRVLYATGVALFLAAPVSLAQFSLTWDFGATNTVPSNTSTPLVKSVVDTGSAAYLTAAPAVGDVTWSGFAGTQGPFGVALPYPAATDAWIFWGAANGTYPESWLQNGTQVIGGSAANPIWGDGTLGSASYIVIDLPDFQNYGGNLLVLESVVVEAGSHGQNVTAGPEVYGVYQLNGGLLGSSYTEWGSAPIPPAQAGGIAAAPWLWNTDSPTVNTIDTSNVPIAPSASFDLLFFAGYTSVPTNGTGPFIIDNITLNFALTAGPGGGGGGGGYAAPNGASGTPEPAGALLGLLSLGMVSFRRKRRS